MDKATPAERKAALALIEKAYTRLECLDHLTFSKYRQRGFDMAKAEEKEHRNPPREGFTWALTVAQAARLFVVKRAAEALVGERLPALRDLYRLQPSYVHMLSCTLDNAEAVRKAWADLDVSAIAALDYAALV